MRWFRDSFPARLLLVAVLLSPVAQAASLSTGQKSYVEALHAFDEGKYAGAATLFRAALAEDPAEGVAKFAHSSGSLNRDDYFPHLYLGLSLEKSGARAEARAELVESKRQGIVLQKPGLTRILEAALRRTEPAASATPETRLAIVVPTPVPIQTQAPHSSPQQTQPAPVRITDRPVDRRTPVPPSPLPTLKAAPVLRRTGIASTISEPVRSGLRSFFEGNFDGARQRLAPHIDAAPVARLFFAYAVASQQLVVKSQDPSLVARARDEYQRARAEGASTAADSFISPAVKRLLSGSGSIQ